jgi:hypothetical protein
MTGVITSDHEDAFKKEDKRIEIFIEAIGMAIHAEVKLMRMILASQLEKV